MGAGPQWFISFAQETLDTALLFILVCEICHGKGHLSDHTSLGHGGAK